MLPSDGARNPHTLPLVESARDPVLPAHGEVEIAARSLDNFVHEVSEHATTRPVELIAVENLVKHDRTSGHLHVAHVGALLVLLVRDHYTVLIDALFRPDLALELVLPNVGKNIPARLELLVDRLEIAETGVPHDYFFLKTKIGSDLKALFPMCFSPTILLS